MSRSARHRAAWLAVASVGVVVAALSFAAALRSCSFVARAEPVASSLVARVRAAYAERTAHAAPRAR